jgi:hypothetical protein
MHLRIHFGSHGGASSPDGDGANLRCRCINRLMRRYGGTDGQGQIPTDVLATLDRELAVFAEEGVLGAIVQLAQMWEPVVAQRASWAVQGSAASSLVLFGIGMLPFCPADHGLLFDRFRIAFRGRPLEIDVVVSPEVMAIVRGAPAPADAEAGQGITLGLAVYPKLEGHLHWEAVQPSLQPPSPEQVQGIITGFQSDVFSDLDFIATDLDFIATGLDFIDTVRPVTFEDLVLCQQLDDPCRIDAGWPERIRTAVDEAAVKSLPEGIDTRFLWQARGLPIFQEDLMAILSRFGGLDPIDAYQLVSAMGFHQDEKVRKGEQGFLEGAARSGFARPHAESLFAIIADGASLATCKSHAISMAYLAAGLALGG